MGSGARSRPRAMPLAAALLVLAVAGVRPGGTSPAAADGDAALRADLGALVSIADGIPPRYEGASPTLLVRRILDAKEKPVRTLLEEAWKRAGQEDAPQAELAVGLERTIRFLWSLEGPAAPPKADPGRIGFGGTVGLLREEQGVVLVRPGGTGARGKVMGEPGWDSAERPSRPAFAALVKGGKWRRAAKPDPRKVLDLLLGGGLDAWDESERRSLAMAAGEIAAGAETSVTRLLERHEAEPSDEWIGTAVAWTGAPAAVEAARRRVAPLSQRVADGREAALPILRLACLALRRHAPDTLAKEVAALEGPARDAALRGAGFRFAAATLLRDHDAAADDAGRDAALLSLVRILGQDPFGHDLPAAADLPGVVRMFLRGARSEDAQMREWAEKGSYLLFFPGTRDGTANENMSQDDLSVQGTGVRHGPYPDMTHVLPRLDEDLAAGRLVPAAEPSGLFDGARPPFPAGPDHFDGAYSGVPNALPWRSEAKPSAPVHLKMEPCDTGFRFTLRNAALKPFAVNPVLFRYPTAESMEVRIGGARDGRKFTRLRLDFGHLWGFSEWAVPASALVTLAPGATYTWDVAVTEEHRKVDHVDVSLFSRIRCPEGSAVAILQRFGDTWVR